MIDLGTFDNMSKYVSVLIEKNQRIDGRQFLEYRKIKIIPNYIKTAEGSAYVELGNTKVIAGVKLDVGEPFPDTPEKGIFIVSEEFLPTAFPTIEAGPPGPDAIEVARIVDRGLRSAEALDLSKMVIEPGKNVWIAFIDIYVINDDGNLVDASFLAAITSLLTARFPKLEKINEDYRVNSKIKTEQKLPVQKIPITLTFTKINDKIILDPTKLEENASSTLFTITISNKNINAFQTRNSGKFTVSDIKQIIKITNMKAKKLKRLVEKSIQ